MPKTNTTKTNVLTRSFAFKPEDYQAFEDKLLADGRFPATFFRKVADEYTRGLYVTVDNLPPGTLEELEKFREEIRVFKMQNVIERIIWDWLDERKKQKSKK